MTKSALQFCIVLSSAILSSCVTTNPVGKDTITFRTLMKQGDPLVHASLLVIGSTWNGSFAFCNGVYAKPGFVVTAGHCLLDEYNYHVFIPTVVRRKNPYTEIVLRAVKVTKIARHPKYFYSFSEGIIKNDIGLMTIQPDFKHVLKPVGFLPNSQKIKRPKSFKWDSSQKSSYFSAAGGNQVDIVGYKIEKNQVTKGVYLIRDATNFVGEIKPYQSMLISLNPGTTIHKGVSGSGIFYTLKDTPYLAGITSHFFPGVNLVSASEVSHYDGWFRQHLETSKK